MKFLSPFSGVGKRSWNSQRSGTRPEDTRDMPAETHQWPVPVPAQFISRSVSPKDKRRKELVKGEKQYSKFSNGVAVLLGKLTQGPHKGMRNKNTTALEL